MTPSYPTGSFNYLQPSEISTNSCELATTKLQIVIVGAGVAGLSAAIALQRDGHHVTIFESTPVLAEIGAGIQVPSNSSRILHSWGLEDALRKVSLAPRSLLWRRWEDGRVIGDTRLNPEFQRHFGSPYYITHRAHLHEILHRKAVELGVGIQLASRVQKYNPDEPSLVLADGRVVHADLIIGADGIRSLGRKTLLGPSELGTQSHGLAVYRAMISTEDIRANGKTAWLLENPSLNLWVGGNQHVMAYSMANGRLFNMVLTHPEKTDPSTWTQEGNVERMKAHFRDWDPTLTALMDMAQSAVQWPIQDVIVADRWSSESRKMLLIGDAAHAMLPFMALGAAMAVEDAAALAETLRCMPHRDMLGQAIAIFERVRIPRVKQVHEASRMHDYTLHLPDGPEQRARDKAMEREVRGEHFVSSPNQWSDPTMQNWVYPHLPALAIRKAWGVEEAPTSYWER